jgi:hypothetical protein
VGSDLIVGAVVRPANEPDHEPATPLLEDARRHGEFVEAIIVRGYLAGTELPSMWQRGVAITQPPACIGRNGPG